MLAGASEGREMLLLVSNFKSKSLKLDVLINSCLNKLKTRQYQHSPGQEHLKERDDCFRKNKIKKIENVANIVVSDNNDKLCDLLELLFAIKKYKWKLCSQEDFSLSDLKFYLKIDIIAKIFAEIFLHILRKNFSCKS